MKKILLSGGTGFVGANLVHFLVKLGYAPTLMIHEKANPWRIQDISAQIQICTTNLQDWERTYKDVSKIKPDIVFHLAAYGTNQSQQQDIETLFTTNILGSANLMNACAQVGCEYFINTGSSSEYGLKEKSITEDDVAEPNNMYAVTKLSSTLTARIISQKYKMPLATLRLFSPFGPFEDKRRFSSTVILNSIRNAPIHLSNPEYVRDFLFIDDVLDAYISFLKNPHLYYGDIFNIGSGASTKLSSFTSTVEVVLKKKLDIIWSKHKSNQLEPKVWQADIGKAKEGLNWQPKTSLQDGIRKTITWFKENGQLYET